MRAAPPAPAIQPQPIQQQQQQQLPPQIQMPQQNNNRQVQVQQQQQQILSQQQQPQQTYQQYPVYQAPHQVRQASKMSQTLGNIHKLRHAIKEVGGGGGAG